MVELYGAAPQPAAAGRAGAAAAAAAAATANAAAAGGSRSNKKARLEPGALPPLGALDAAAAAAAAAATAASVPGGGSEAELASQAAALALLAAVIRAGGAMLAPELRARYDAAAVHVGQACHVAGVKVSCEPGAAAAAHAEGIKVLQLESLMLMLATVLAPCAHRPPFLSEVGSTPNHKFKAANSI